jgi:hypothetical protein
MSRVLLDVGALESRKPRVEALCAAARADGWRVAAAPQDVSRWPANWRQAGAAVTCGMHVGLAEARAQLAAAGIPLIVTDLGYIRRASRGQHEGYHQVGLGRIGWLPPFACPLDRWKALGVEIETRGLLKGKRVLVLGQVEWDSQHGLGDSQLGRWLQLRATTVARMVGGGRLVFRPHPEAPSLRGRREWAEVEDPGSVPLEESIRKSRVVVTYNSTAGVEAVRLGAPVVCDPSAHFAEVAMVASAGERERYFARLAYGQWNLAELRDGTAWKFIKGAARIA